MLSSLLLYIIKSSVHKIGIASELSSFLTLTCPFMVYPLYL